MEKLPNSEYKKYLNKLLWLYYLDQAVILEVNLKSN
jgi:hypothetical protein